MRTIFLGIAVSLLAVGCRSKEAFNFSEDIVKIERKLGESVKETQPQILHYMQESIYDSLAYVGGDMVKKTEESIDEINALRMPAINEAANFKAAAIRYFTHIRNIYDSYKIYAEQPNDSLRSVEAENMVRLEDGMADMVKEMQGAQQKFAEANGFKIDN